MKRQTYEKILRLGLALSFLIFFLQDQSVIYPHVIIKQVYFNVLIEVMLVAWLALIIKYPASRPQKSPLTFALAAFFLVLLVSALSGVDFNISFWGELSRLLGWFQIIHLLVFYLILITVAAGPEDWRRLFELLVLASVGVAVYGLVTHSAISTLGIHSNVAGLLLFGFYYCLWLLAKNNNWWWRGWHLIAIILILVGFFYVNVSGSQAALAVSLIFGAVIFGAGNKNKKIKIWTWSGLAAFVLIIGLLFTLRSQPLFDNTRIGKIFRDFSFSNVNFDTRLFAWRAAWLGFLERPLLGWGYGNFSAPADKYFTAKFYDYALHEEYFDRAHNNLLDLAATSGALGLAAYLSIFAAAAYGLIKARKNSRLDLWELAVITAIFVGYFVHNLAVFDALANYFCLMLALGYVYYLNSNVSEEVKEKKSAGLTNGEILVWLIAGSLAMVLIYNYNLKVLKMARQTMSSLEILQQGSAKDFLASYQKPFAYRTPLDRTAQGKFIEIFIQQSDKIKVLPEPARREVIDYFIDLARKNLALNPGQHQALFRNSLFFNALGDLTGEKKYYQEALTMAEAAIASGPQHIPTYFLKASSQVALEEPLAAVDTLQTALKLSSKYYLVYCYLAKVQLDQPDQSSQTAGRQNQTTCYQHVSEARRPVFD